MLVKVSVDVQLLNCVPWSEIVAACNLTESVPFRLLTLKEFVVECVVVLIGVPEQDVVPLYLFSMIVAVVLLGATCTFTFPSVKVVVAVPEIGPVAVTR